MTTNEVILDRPTIGTIFNVISCFWRSRLFRFALNFSTEIFTRHNRFLSQSGISKFVVYPWQFCRITCKWEYEFIIGLCDRYLLRVHSTKINIWCIQFTQFFQICYHKYLLFKFLPRSVHSQEKIPGSTFLPNWWILVLIFRWSGMIFNHCSKGYYWPFEWFSKSSFMWRLPVRYHPPFIQSWL